MTTMLNEQTTADHSLIEHDENGEQRFTHIVNCPDEYPDTESYLAAAVIEGFPVEALCGKRWVPNRDPKKYPVCEPCLDEAERIQSEVFRRRGL